MADRDTLDAIAEELASALLPLEEALASPENFAAFILELGWSLETPPSSVSGLSAPVRSLSAIVEGGEVDKNTVQAVLSGIRAFLGGADAVQNEPAGSFPGGFDVASFKAEFPAQLLQYLIVDYLLGRQARFGAVLKALGVIRL